jgi:hypothetical protein
MSLQLWNHSPLIGMIMAIILLLAAWNFGAAAERWMAVAFAIQFPMAVLQQWAFGRYASQPPFSQFMPVLCVQDMVMLAVFSAIALRANRLYPLGVAAAQLIIVTAHMVRLMRSDLLPGVYAAMVTVPAYFEAAAILAGIAIHTARSKRFGRYPAWRQA